jgi:hypothetical protein
MTEGTSFLLRAKSFGIQNSNDFVSLVLYKNVSCFWYKLPILLYIPPMLCFHVLFLN